MNKIIRIIKGLFGTKPNLQRVRVTKVKRKKKLPKKIVKRIPKKKTVVWPDNDFTFKELSILNPTFSHDELMESIGAGMKKKIL